MEMAHRWRSTAELDLLIALESIASRLAAASPSVRRSSRVARRRGLLSSGRPDRPLSGTRIARVSRVDIGLLKGVDRDARHPRWRTPSGSPPACLPTTCPAVGCARHGQVVAGEGGACHDQRRPASRPTRLKLIEIHREDIDTLPKLMNLLKAAPFRFILFCDDLSFDHDDTSYKSLKAALEGGVEGRPANVIFYATSNRRHLLPRDMIDNERSTAINPSEAVEEKVSLSDRFGLWLGFHKCSQDEYLEMVNGYACYHGFANDPETLRAEALEWATTRGSRSGRVAWQFIQDLAGRLGQPLKD
jgi:hypothetical protein